MIPFLHIGLAQACFAILFMITRRPNQLSDKIFSAWMVFLALPMVGRLLIELGFPETNLVNKVRSYAFTFGPFLLLYARSLTSEHPRLKPVDALHFLPFLIIGIFQVIGPLPPPPGGPPPGAEPGMRPPPFFRFVGIGNILSLLIYTVYVLSMLHKHSKDVMEQFSYTSTRLTLGWLKWTTICFAITYLSFLLVIWAFRTANQPPPFALPGMAFTSFIFALSFFGFRQPVIYPEAESVEEPASKNGHLKAVEELQEAKYEKSGLTDEQAGQHLEVLEQYMNDKKPYLDPDLTLQRLSEDLDIPKHHLTQVINEKLNKNFYLFVNEYRVYEVQQRILDPEHAHLTILAIAYDSGFNSKSGFNTIFKRVTGVTPSQFRKTQTAA